MSWWTVWPARAPGKPTPPGLPFTAPKVGGGTVVFVSWNWHPSGTGEVIGVDATGGRWRKRDSDGLAELVE
jgi:hypothetical protein